MTLFRLMFAVSVALGAAACSSTSGDGAKPSSATVVVVPDGQRIVCTDGTAPPCR